MLLETAYKIIANIIRSRLIPISESIDHESQCGFRPGRSTIDSIFSLKAVLKKRKEHGLETYVLFLDLVKAFDKVPRDTLWKVRSKFGVPSKLLNLIVALHTDIQVDFEFQGIKKSFLSQIGVKQGDVLGPILFNFYIAAIMISWRNSTTINACIFKSSNDFKTTGRNHNNMGTLFSFRDSAYADDTAVTFTSREDLQNGTQEICLHFDKWGMSIHTGNQSKISKSEIVKFSQTPQECNFPDIILCPNNSFIPLVSKFCYLGSIIDQSLSDRNDVINRIVKAGKAFGALRKPIFKNRDITNNSKARIYCAIIIPTLIYGSENWCITVADENKLQTFHNNCIRKIYKISRLTQQRRHITITSLRSRNHIPSIQTLLTRHFLRWAGHISRMSWDRLQRKLLSSWINRSRNNGSPGMTYGKTLNKHLQRAGLNPSTWHQLAKDKSAWRKMLYDINC